MRLEIKFAYAVPHRWRVAVGGLLLITITCGTAGIAPLWAQAQPVVHPSYTMLQAQRGRAAYAEYCGSCHGESLSDGEFAPPLKGVEFRRQWGSRSAETLFT